MKENAKFLKCPICDNIIELIDGDVQHITCCGRKMEEMKANTTDAATETRFPYISGATLYAYCNKHGLWKTTIK